MYSRNSRNRINEHSMDNIGTLSQTASIGTQKTKPHSNDTVDAVEPQGVATDVDVDRVRKLSEERKLAEKYIMSRLCSSREFDFIAMCDDQSQTPFWCGD